MAFTIPLDEDLDREVQAISDREWVVSKLLGDAEQAASDQPQFDQDLFEAGLALERGDLTGAMQIIVSLGY